jgi:ribonuclease G
VALLEDKQLVQVMLDRPDQGRMLGDIFLGRVDAVLPGIQAAFVDIGAEKAGFLHVSDLNYGDDEDPDAENGDGNGNDRGHGRGRRRSTKYPPIQENIQKGQSILVQVTKEPISSKGSRLTAQVSLPGRFMVYMPYTSHVGVSRKIEGRDQRSKLRKMAKQIVKPDSGGMIVRTVGEEVTKKKLANEYKLLSDSWRKIQNRAKGRTAPASVHREAQLISGVIRDLFSDKFDAVRIDSKAMYNEVLEYVKSQQHRDQVLHELRTQLGKDRARTKAFGISDLGLIEMTRQRVRPSLFQSLTSECTLCGGMGRVYTPATVVRRIERSLRRAASSKQEKQIVVRVHPEVALRVMEVEPELLKRLRHRTRLRLDLRDDPLMRLDEFRLLSGPAETDVTDKYVAA